MYRWPRARPPTPGSFSAAGGRNNNNAGFTEILKSTMKEAPGGGIGRYGTSVFGPVEFVFALTTERRTACCRATLP